MALNRLPKSILAQARGCNSPRSPAGRDYASKVFRRARGQPHVKKLTLNGYGHGWGGLLAYFSHPALFRGLVANPPE